MDFEKMDVISNRDDSPELDHCDFPISSNSNMTVMRSNQSLIPANECCTVLQPVVEPCKDLKHVFEDTNEISSFMDDAVKAVCTSNSTTCSQSGVLKCEFMQNKSLSCSTEYSMVNQLDNEIKNLHLVNKYIPLNFLSKKVDQMKSTENDNESVCTDESSAHDYLEVDESSSTVHSICDSDSLKTCADEDSNHLNDSDVGKHEPKKCSTRDDKGNISSGIKERVMRFLNKHSGSCDSLDEEQPNNKILVKKDKLINRTELREENCSLKCLKEDTVMPTSSSNIVNFAISPIPNSQDDESSSIETDTYVEEKGKTSLTSDIYVSKPVTSTEVKSDSSKNETARDLNEDNSSDQCFIVNIGNKMEVNDSIDLTKNSNADTFINSPFSEPVINPCESEMQFSSPHPSTSSNSFSQLETVGSAFFECRGSVDLTQEGNNKFQYCQQRATASAVNSHSLVDQCSPSFYNKTGTVVTNPSLCSWGKLSFQSLTTPSINFPILSSKSDIEEKTADISSLAKCTPITDSKCDIDESSEQYLSKDDLKSRKTKSTEALFSNVKFSSCTDTIFSDNISGKSTSKISNLHFVSPIVHTESSWSENSLHKNIKLGPEKLFSDSFSATDSKETSNSSFGSVTNDPFNRVLENPFSKKCSESIGIFNSSQEKSFSELSPVFKTVSNVFSPQKEKVCEQSSNLSGDFTSNFTGGTNETTPFGFKLNCENKQDHVNMTPRWVFKSSEQSSDAKKFAFNPGNQSGLESKDTFLRVPKEAEDIQYNKAETATSLSSINISSFQCRVNGEKSKPLNRHRYCRPRLWYTSTKSYKQNDKGFSKFTKETNVFNSSVNDVPNAPFKPAYGSDVILDKSSRGTKNVIVRYQNIVYMKEYLNVSPDELRLQYYNKTRVTGPFKFCASAEYKESNSYKKGQNKEVQTDENGLSKGYELSEIWRALECPVCLDVVMPPVYQCEQGHHACLTCWNKVVTCPLCKRHKSVTRNYMAEALIDQIPLPCKYHIEGCKETVCRANKVSHEETCSYRMYQCPVPSCNQAHSYQNMCTHFKKFHKSLLHHEGHSVGKGEKFCDVLYKELLSSSLIHAFDITKWGLFFLREVVTKHSKALFVQVMPASPEPAAYFYHLEVCDHHDCRKECYKGRVFSMGKPIQEILDEEEYLSLSVLILKTVKKSAPLKIVVTIWQFKSAFTLSAE